LSLRSVLQGAEDRARTVTTIIMTISENDQLDAGMDSAMSGTAQIRCRPTAALQATLTTSLRKGRPVQVIHPGGRDHDGV
jgi:hypothetical protein